jgi:cell division FtsZ-interacting protein ZapD
MLMDAAVGADGLDFDEFVALVRERRKSEVQAWAQGLGPQKWAEMMIMMMISSSCDEIMGHNPRGEALHGS